MITDDAIGDEGYLAVAEALQPRVNPDGSLAHAAVDAMQLLSEDPLPDLV